MSNTNFAAGETITLTIEQLNKLLHSENGTVVDGYKVAKCFVINWWERSEGQFEQLVVTRENSRKQFSTTFWPVANSWIDPFEERGVSVDDTSVVMTLYSNKVLRTTDNRIRFVREERY